MELRFENLLFWPHEEICRQGLEDSEDDVTERWLGSFWEPLRFSFIIHP